MHLQTKKIDFICYIYI